MKAQMNLNSPIFKVLMIFLAWRIFLVVILFFAVAFIPLAQKDRFLGGGPFNFSLSPYFFSWANFDGEHYLSIAILGYKSLEQAFFPVFPLLISFFARPDPFNLLPSLVNSTLAGLFISNISFVLALIYLWELVKIDFSKKIAYLTIILLLSFPTSFYFGSLYNESLFLLLSVLSFYSARKGNFFLAGVFGAVSSATRVFGILLLPALIIEALLQKKSKAGMLWLLLIPVGLGAYMWYLNSTIGDPLAFYHYQTLVGQQHQSGITLLPQVYFRYIKMLATTSVQNPIFQTLVLEFFVGLAFFFLPVYGYFKKIRLSYLVYASLSFLIPAAQGSFSSAPRYVLVLFPSFLAAALWTVGLPKLVRIVVLALASLGLFMEAALFLRGYWIA